MFMPVNMAWSGLDMGIHIGLASICLLQLGDTALPLNRCSSLLMSNFLNLIEFMNLV